MAFPQFPNVPGVQIREERLGAPPIEGVGTSTAGFAGKAPKAHATNTEPRPVTSADQFAAEYILKKPDVAGDTSALESTPLSRAVFGFFDNGGRSCWIIDVPTGSADDTVAALKKIELIDEVAIIAAPGQTDKKVYDELQAQAFRTGDRFAILDPPAKVADLATLKPGGANRPSDSIYSAFYYPRIAVGKRVLEDPDALKNDKDSEFVTPSGHLAGVYARVDAAKGVHKAPANEVVLGALALEHRLGDAEQETLNIDGVNLLRIFSEGVVVWGARTLLAANAADKSYRYVPVRRLVNYIEESLQESLRFAVFEPNNLALRQTITRSVRGFLVGVWRDGALFGATPEEAFYVRFPEAFNRDEDRNLGKLTLEVGLRPASPAEFIIVRIGLLTQSAAAA